MGHMIPGGTGYEYHKKVNKFIESQQIEELVIDFSTEAVGQA
jgi:DNA-directed RNA polymerase subunit beta'